MRNRAGYKDYYKILGLTKAATPAEIKKAYRRLALKHHPDRNPGDPEAAVRFIEVAEAYETLADPERRRAYDRSYKPSQGTRESTGAAPPPPTVPAVSTLLELPWKTSGPRIRRHHPEIPPVVIIIASGTGGKQASWGHHAPARWHHDGTEHAEVMISGEGLHRTPAKSSAPSFTKPPTPWPPHAASPTPAARAATTTESSPSSPLNSAWTPLKTAGSAGAVTTVPGTTARRYADELAALRRHDRMAQRRARRRPPASGTTNLIAAICPCGRTIRVAASTLEEAPITCQACDGTFEPKI